MLVTSISVNCNKLANQWGSSLTAFCVVSDASMWLGKIVNDPLSGFGSCSQI